MRSAKEWLHYSLEITVFRFAQQFFMVFFRQDHWHPGVNHAYQLIGLTCNDRAGANHSSVAGSFRVSHAA